MALQSSGDADAPTVTASSDSFGIRGEKGRGKLENTEKSVVSSQAELLSARESAALCGVSVRQWWRWDSSGKVPAAVKIGSTKRWRRDELRQWIDAGCPLRMKWEIVREFSIDKKEASC